MGLPAKLPVPTPPPRIGSAITEALSLFRLAVLSGDAEREREAAAKTGSVVGWEIAQAHAVASGYTRHP